MPCHSKTGLLAPQPSVGHRPLQPRRGGVVGKSCSKHCSGPASFHPVMWHLQQLAWKVTADGEETECTDLEVGCASPLPTLHCADIYPQLIAEGLGSDGEGNGTPLQYSSLENPMDRGAWWAAIHGVAKSRTRLSDFTFTFLLHALEKEMATHSSVLAWRIPGTGEPGGLLSMGSRRVGHN